MKKIGKKLFEYWYLFVIIGLILLEAIIFLGLGENSYIATTDNLDLFIPHFRMLKLSGTFFTQGDILPILGGVTRDNFGSEFSLYNDFSYLLRLYCRLFFKYCAFHDLCLFFSQRDAG